MEIGKFIKQQIGDRTVAEFAKQIGVNSLDLQGVIDGNVYPSDYILEKVAHGLHLNKLYLFYIARDGGWPPEHRNLPPDEFHRRFGFGLNQPFWAIAS